MVNTNVEDTPEMSPPTMRKSKGLVLQDVARILLRLEETGFLQNWRTNLMLYKILLFIHKHPGSSVYEIAEGFGVSPKTAHRYLANLRKDGIVTIRLGKRENIHRYYLNEFVANSLDDLDSKDKESKGERIESILAENEQRSSFSNRTVFRDIWETN